MNYEEWLKWREEYFRKAKRWEEEETNRKERRKNLKKRKRRRANSSQMNDRAWRFKILKLKAKVSSLESENKKLKKDLLRQKIRSRDRAVYIQR